MTPSDIIQKIHDLEYELYMTEQGAEHRRLQAEINKLHEQYEEATG